MTNRYPPPPPDEPIIGGGYAPRTSYPGDSEPVIGGWGTPGAPAAAPEWDDEYDNPYDDYDEYGYDDDYPDSDGPARSPIVYLAIAGVIALIAAVGFLAFAMFGGGDDETPAAGFNVAIDTPRAGDKINLGEPTDIAVQASSNEAIVRFELLVDGEVVAENEVESPQAGVVTRTTFRHTFEDRGNHAIRIRVTADSGATEESDDLPILVIESVDTPIEIEGDVRAAVNARSGPGDEYPVVGSLRSGDVVTIKGKTRNLEWLLVDSSAGDGVWVRANSIEPRDALALVPVREPTALPAPTSTEEPSPEPSETATPDSSLPDLAPAGAVPIAGGTQLQVTILNNGGSGYSGGLVVSVAGMTGGTLTQAFGVDIPAKGSDTVVLDIPEITEQKVARVTVDPDNAVKEGAEDNNSGNFTVNPVAEPPVLGISYSVEGGTVVAKVGNTGGELETADLQVCVSVQDSQGATSSKCAPTQTVALANGQTVTFEISSPPSGTGTLVLTVDGVAAASTAIALG